MPSEPAWKTSGWAKAFQDAAPHAVAFTNFLPMRENADGSGKVEGQYEQYLTSYLEPAKPRAFSFDHYSFIDDGNIRPLYFDCLEIARQASIKNGVPLMFPPDAAESTRANSFPTLKEPDLSAWASSKRRFSG